MEREKKVEKRITDIAFEKESPFSSLEPTSEGLWRYQFLVVKRFFVKKKSFFVCEQEP